MSDELAGRLRAAGLSAAGAERKGELFEAAGRALEEVAGPSSGERLRCYVPGRIELLGKHVDYAGGSSLLCAVERGLCVVAAARSDPVVRIVDAARGEQRQFRISAELAWGEGWEAYPRAVGRRLARNFPGPLRGVDAAIAGDLPPAAGLSSSSVMIVATFSLLAAINDLPGRGEYRTEIGSDEDLAGYLACIENGRSFGSLAGDRGVGTRGGSEDHTAILCCRPGIVSRFSFCPVKRLGEAPLPAGHTFVIGVSGVVADKTGGALRRYNRAAGAVETMLRLWNEKTGRDDRTIVEVADSESYALDALRRLLRESREADHPARQLEDRLDHFFAERGRVRSAFLALSRGDLEHLGRVVDESQAAAERLLGNQVPETVGLARSARALGAVAATAFGAGFGGSVWALVPSADAGRFRESWEAGHRESFPQAARRAHFFLSGAGPGLLRL